MTQANGQLSNFTRWLLDFQLNDGLVTGSPWYDFTSGPNAADGAASTTLFHPGPATGPIQSSQPAASATSFESNVANINTGAVDFVNSADASLAIPANIITLNPSQTSENSGPLAHAGSLDSIESLPPDLNMGTADFQVTSAALIQTNSTTFTAGTATATSASDLNALIKAADLASSGTFTINISGSLALNTLPAVTNGENITIINNVATVTKLTAVPDIFAINLHSGVSLVFNGTNSAILDGGSTVRGLFAYAGNVTVNNLTIQNTVAQGGAGASAGFAGGGGAGLGGGLFVASAANVTLNSVTFSNNKAIGGAGGNNLGGASEVWGGGGGLGGNGGATFGGLYFSGGGGVGRTAFGGTGSNNGRAVANGGDGTQVPGPGIIVGGAHAGNGAFLVSTDPHTSGAIYGGGGGVASGTGHNISFPTPDHYYGAGSGGGGVGGHNGYSKSAGYNSKNTGGGGGVGGFGGGGGAGYYYGGNGGFGGGGGAGQYSYGGNGGFGGGGGGLPNKAGTLAQGGFGAGKAGGGYNIGNGRTPTYKLSGGDSGGGGLGAGGAVFVQSGGVLTLGGAGTVGAGTVAGGAGGIPAGTNGNGAGTAGTAGSGFGSSIFIQNNSTSVAQGVTFGPGAGQTLTVSGVIADQQGSGGAGANASQGKLAVQGGGVLRLTGANTFKGGSAISGGSTLDLGASGAGGAGAITFNAGSNDRLLIEAAALSGGKLGNTVNGLDVGDVLDFTGLAFTAGASVNIVSNVLSVVSNGVTNTVTLSGQAANMGLVAVQDAATGTKVIASNFTISTEAQLLADLAIVNSGGIGAAPNVGYTFTFLNAVAQSTGGETVNLLSGSSITYAGTGFPTGNTTKITAGSLISGASGALGSGGFSIGASGTVSLNGFAQTIADLTGSGQFLVQGATLTEGTANSTSFAGSITGTPGGKLVKQGAGTLTLGGTDTLPGGLTINAGGVNLTSATAMGGAGTIAFGAGTGDVLEFHLTSVPTNTIAGFVRGQTLDLNMSGTTVTGASIVNTNTLQLALSAGGPISLTLSPAQNWIGANFSHSTVGSDNFITEVRFSPVVTAGGTVSYDGGASPVIADAGLTVVDQASATLVSAKVVIGGFISGDTLTVGTLGGLTPNFSNGTLTLTGPVSLATYQTALESITFSSTLADPSVGHTQTSRTITWVVNDGVAVSNTGTSAVNVTCYRLGTRILTDHGEVAVEDLRIGDRVVTLCGAPRPIKWIGCRSIDLTRHSMPDQVRPIMIRAGAVADGMPRRDLYVSPDHAILIDDALILARQLVNGASIARDMECRLVTYYHIELETHDILMAEGLPAESYLDTGNRGMFENGGAPLILHPDMASGQQRRVAGSRMPLIGDPAWVEPIWRRLTERGERMGFGPPMPSVARDPDPRLIVAGRTIAPVRLGDGRYLFPLPPAETPGVPVRLVSSAARPSDERPWIDDRRRLGVAVTRIALHHGMETDSVSLDDPCLTRGWWDVEHSGSAASAAPMRWTDGDATISLPGRGRGLLEIVLAGALSGSVEAALSPFPPLSVTPSLAAA